MKDRHTLFPIVNRPIFDLYEQQVKSLWTPYEIDYSKDKDQFNKLEKDEKHLVLQILAFFAQSDAIVNENLCFRFMKDINIPEMLQFYSMQIGVEAIHSHTYALLIDNYIDDAKEKDRLFNAIKNFPAIEKKANWMKKWILSQDSFAKRLFAFSLVEGVFFAGSFCTIFWFRDKNKLPALSHANRLIQLDENLHMLGAAVLYKELLKLDGKIKKNEFILRSQIDSLQNEEIGRLTKENHILKKFMLNNSQEFKKITQEEAQQITEEAVSIEKEFINESIRVQLLGINANLMSQYIQYIADLNLSEFGFQKIYNVKQPFDFMRKMDIRTKVNFFEDRSSEYLAPKREDPNFDQINEEF